jgi:5'-nucleotidase
VTRAPVRRRSAGQPAARAGAPSSETPVRAWQRMLSGRRLDLLDPSPLDIEIEDIAHGLARVARWNGQTRGAHIFSVAQHTLLVDAIARELCPNIDRRLRLAVLLHDSPEYVIGDLISPFKAVMGDAYKSVETRLLSAIHVRFGLPRTLSEELQRLIKQADQAAAGLEATHLAGFETSEAHRYFGRTPALAPTVQRDYMTPWPAEVAERRFLQHFAELTAP